jgi:hypothetical protein
MITVRQTQGLHHGNCNTRFNIQDVECHVISKSGGFGGEQLLTELRSYHVPYVTDTATAGIVD